MESKYSLSGTSPRHNTEAGWNLQATFVPVEGEIIIYDADDDYKFPRFKVGDGVTTVVDLPFSKTDEFIAGLIRVNANIAPAHWILAGTEYEFTIEDDRVQAIMDIAEFNLDNPQAQLAPVHIETYDGKIVLTTEKLPINAWACHILLGTVFNANARKIDYPKLGLVRVRFDADPTDWLADANGYYINIYDENLFEVMNLIEWEPDAGLDLPWKIRYTTYNGHVELRSSSDITITVGGYLTFGVDSASMTASLQADAVVSVNGKKGVVTVKEGVPSINGISISISTAAWTSGGTWTSNIVNMGMETGNCYYYNYTNSSCTEGDRFDCSLCYGGNSRVYATPYNGYIRIETANLPTGTVYIQGSLLRESL